MTFSLLKGITRRQDVAAALATMLFAAAGTFLLIGQPPTVLSTVVLGRGGDPYQTLWRFDGLGHAVTQGSLTVPGDPFRNWGPLPWLPLHFLLGEPLAYNVVWIISAPLAALAMFLLARVLGMSRLSGALAGTLVAFAPYRVAQSLGHFGAMQVFWIPAVLTGFVATIRRPTLLRLIATAVLLIGTAWTEHTLFLTTLIALVLCGGVFWRDVRSGLTSWRRRLAAGIAIAAVVVFGVLPFTSEVRRTVAPDSRLTPSTEQRLRFTPKISSLVAQPSFHFSRSATNPYGSTHDTVADRTVALGVFAPILAFVALWRHRKATAHPARGGALLVLLAVFGVALAVAPRAAPRLLDIPFVSAIRVVNRFLVLTAFALPLLAAQALNGFSSRLIQLAIAAVLVLDILPLPPFPNAPTVLPIVAALRAERPGPVLAVAAAADDVIASRALYASTQHGHAPIGQGAFTRVEESSARSALLRVPVVRDLLLLRATELERPTLFGQQPAVIAHAALASEGIVAVVVHTRVDTEPVRAFQNGGFRPASDEALTITRAFLQRAGFIEEPLGQRDFLFRIPPWPAKRTQLIAAPRTGWERSTRRPDGTLQAALQNGATLDLRVQGQARTVTLTFAIPRHARRNMLSVRDADTALGAWSVIPGQRLVVPLGVLLSGSHLLTFMLDADELVVENPSVLISTP